MCDMNGFDSNGLGICAALIQNCIHTLNLFYMQSPDLLDPHVPLWEAQSHDSQSRYKNQRESGTKLHTAHHPEIKSTPQS